MAYAGKLTISSTSTGTYGLFDLREPCGTVAVEWSHGSTKQIAFMPQGSIGGIHWVSLNAAATTAGESALTGVANSTVAGLFQLVRLSVTANDSTGNITSSFAVAGKP